MSIKRLFAIVICVIMVLTLLASCDNKVSEDVVTPDILVLNAFENNATARYKMTVTEKVTVISNEGFPNEGGENSCVIYMDGKNFHATSTDMDGIETVAILVCETLYMNYGGVKHKYDVPISSWESKYYELVGSTIPTDLDLMKFEEVNEEKNADGSVTVTFKKPIPDAEFDMYDYSYSVSGVTSSYKVDKDSVVYVYVIGADGRVMSSRTNMTATLSVKSLDGSMSYSMTYNNDVYAVYDYGDVREVTAPGDADEY